MNTSVDNYFIIGCGRCPLSDTPECKVHSYIPELKYLRQIALECGLTEECKWGSPCYTYQNKNVFMITTYKDFCCISFFKGSLLSDSKNILAMPGPNSQAMRLLKFTDVKEIEKIESDIKAYIYEAVEVEKAGLTVAFKTNPEPIPEELEQKFEEDPLLKSAFEALTPGRQRGFILFISQPKQSQTRVSRIEKCIPMILAGIGLHDKYSSKKK